MGDTTTGKSQVSKTLIKVTNAGMYITAETASIAGLTGAATQIEKAGWFVDWGFLPLNDRKLLITDGVQKLSKGASAEMAEAEREGIVRISKAAKNTAYARTRQIKIANPIDPQAGKFSTKKINEFLYPIQALSTVFDRISIARLDLAVFSRENDVSIEDVNRRFDDGYDHRIHYLSEVVRWCWSDTAEIVFGDDAIDALLDRATKLYNKFYYGDIPIVSIDMKWKLARLSVALAYLTLSADEDYKKVIVKKEHVEYIADFIDREYTEAGLHILAESARYEKMDLEEANELIQRISMQCNISEDTVKDIVGFIVMKGRVTRDQIMQKYGLSERNELRPLLAILAAEDLIKSGKGIYPRPKLIDIYRLVCQGYQSYQGQRRTPIQKDWHNEDEKIVEGVNSEVGNLGNLGKKDDNSEMLVNIMRKIDMGAVLTLDEIIWLGKNHPELLEEYKKRGKHDV